MSRGKALLLLLAIGGILVVLIFIVLPAQQASSLIAMAAPENPPIATVQVLLQEALPSAVTRPDQPFSQTVNGIGVTLNGLRLRPDDAAFDLSLCHSLPNGLEDLPVDWLLGPASAEINDQVFLGLENVVLARSADRLCRQFTFHQVPTNNQTERPLLTRGQIKVIFERLSAAPNDGQTCRLYEQMLQRWRQEGKSSLEGMSCQEVNGAIQIHFPPSSSSAAFEEWMVSRLRIEGPWLFAIPIP